MTDEFIAHVKAGGSVDNPAQWDLEQTTSFLLVAATLLDLKAARLLPQGDVEDEEGPRAAGGTRPALRAPAPVQGVPDGSRPSSSSGSRPRRAATPGRWGSKDRFAGLLPEVLIGIGLDSSPSSRPRRWSPSRCSRLSLHHIRAASVSVREQAALVVDQLRRSGTMTFPRSAGTRRTGSRPWPGSCPAGALP